MSRPILLQLALQFLFAALVAAQQDMAADRAYDLAAGLHDRGLHARSIRAFEGFLERWPDHPRQARARFHLADSLLAEGRPEAALEQLDAFLKAPDRNLARQAAYARGDALTALGRPAEAARSFQAAIGRADDELGRAAVHFAAESLAAAGDDRAAREMHERLREARGSTWRLHSLAALAFLAAAAGDHEKALGDFGLVALEAEGDLALEARLMAATCMLELGRHEDALRAARRLAPALSGERRARGAIVEGRALVALDRIVDAGRPFAGARGLGLDDELDRALIRCAAALHERERSEEGLELLALVPASSGQSSDAQYWRGILAGASGRSDEAIVALRGALEAGDDPRRRYRLADALMRAGRLKEAVTEFQAVIAARDVERTLRDESRFALGFCLDSLGDRAAAAAVFAKLDEKEVAGDLRLEAVFARAESLFDLEEHAEALPLYARVARSERVDLRRPARYKLAFCLERLGRKDEALDLFGKLAAVRPTDELSHDCALMKARLLSELGRDGEAATAYGAAAAVAADPEAAASAGLARAALLRREGSLEKAARAYRELLDAAGESGALALFGLAACCAESGDEAAACEHWERFLERHGDHRLAPEARLGLAWARRSLGREEAALELLTRPFSVVDLEAERLFLAGELLRSLGRDADALEVLRACARARPDGPRAPASLLAAGILGRSTGDLTGAARDLDSLIGRDEAGPELVPALYERALVALAQDEAGRAQGLFRRLEEDHAASPQGRDAIFRLAEMDYARAEHEPALARYEALLARDDIEDDLEGRCAFKRAFSLEKIGRLPEALEGFSAIGRAGADFAQEASFQAGDLALRQGEAEAALEHFERAFSLDSKAELGLAAGRRALAVLGRLGRHADVVRRSGGRIDLEARDAWSIQAMVAYADARLELGETRSARRVHEIVADHGGADDAARARWMMGKSLTLEGRKDEAVEAYLAVTIFHDVPVWSARALLAAAEILSDGGEYKKARALLDDLLRDHPDEDAAAKARELAKRVDAEMEKNR